MESLQIKIGRSFLLLAILLFGVMGDGCKNESKPDEITAEEYAIYRQLGGGVDGKLGYIADSTMLPIDWNVNGKDSLARGDTNGIVETMTNPKMYIPVPVPVEENSVDTAKHITWLNVVSYLQKLYPSYDIGQIKRSLDSSNTKKYFIDSTITSRESHAVVLSKDHYLNKLSALHHADQVLTWTAFSRVGFDHSRRLALVCMRTGYPSNYGWAYKLLKKSGAQWVTIQTVVRMEVLIQ